MRGPVPLHYNRLAADRPRQAITIGCLSWAAFKHGKPSPRHQRIHHHPPFLIANLRALIDFSTGMITCNSTSGRMLLPLCIRSYMHIGLFMQDSIFTRMHAYTRADIHTYVTYLNMYIHAYIHILHTCGTCIHTDRQRDIYTYAHTHTFGCTYGHTYIHAYIHTYVRTYMHTYIIQRQTD